MKKVYVNKIVGPNNRGRWFGRWKDTVKGYMFERSAARRGRFEQARGKYLDWERWSPFCYGHPFGGTLPERVRCLSYR